jgi:hypothetical protein
MNIMKGLYLNLMCACVITIAILIAYHLGRRRVGEYFVDGARDKKRTPSELLDYLLMTDEGINQTGVDERVSELAENFCKSAAANYGVVKGEREWRRACELDVRSNIIGKGARDRAHDDRYSRQQRHQRRQDGKMLYTDHELCLVGLKKGQEGKNYDDCMVASLAAS